MKQFWVALALLAAVSVPADAQGLPPEVAAAYQEYDAAFGEGDYQAAQSAAARAYEAARAADLDAGTLGLLAENYAFALAQAHNYQLAAVYWERSAEHGETAGAAPLDMAWRWHNAGLNANATGDLETAGRLSTAARAQFDLIEPNNAGDLNLGGEIYFLAARVAGQSGDYTASRGLVTRALDGFARGGREPDVDYAMAHYLAGMTSLADRHMTSAGYHFYMTGNIARYTLQDERLAVLARALEYLVTDREDDCEGDSGLTVRALLDADPIYGERYAALSEARERAEGVVRREGAVDAVPLRRRAPRYPSAALREGLEGVAVVRFDVNEQGGTENIEVLAGLPTGMFDAAARRAVEGWRYEPATLDGVPTYRENIVTYFNFGLSR